MKRHVMWIVLAALVTTAAPAMAMNVDDILELCRAGFEPDRIARIVETAGMDQPLEASDWARIKSEGCGDDVIDALLDVLAVSDEDVETNDDAYDSDVDENVSGNWGYSGMYGSLFWGGIDPWWAGRYAWYDPWYYSWGPSYCNSYWSDPWWCGPYSHHYYRYIYHDPFYYCGGDYIGGYYSGGSYQRQKAARQGGSAKSYRYASAKSSAVGTKATYASAKAKPYRNGEVLAGMNSNGAVGYRKSTRTAATTADGQTVVKRKTETYARGTIPTSTGIVKQKTRSTSTTPQTGQTYSKRKTAATHGGVSTGARVGGTKTKTRTGTATPNAGQSSGAKRKSSGVKSTSQSNNSASMQRSAPAARSSMPTVRSGGASHRSSGAPSGGAARVRSKR